MDQGKQKHFASMTTDELNHELKVLLCGDNNGGILADDIIEELGKRNG